MSDRKKKSSDDALTWGLILLALGVIFLLDSLRIASVGEIFSTYWPVIIIVIGVRMVIRALPEKDKTAIAKNKLTSKNDYLRMSKTFGSVGLKIDSKKFTGGKVSSVFGDVLLDLSDANISTGEKRLKLNGVVGDISVSLPKNVKVSVRANTLLGDLSIMDFRKSGFAVSRRYESEGFERANKKLVISASQVLGDVTVSHALD